MGLFDKKYCDICGEKIGLLGNRKLEDGNLCKKCAEKLSPLFSGRRSATVEEIKAQLAYREENRQKLDFFRPTKTFGRRRKVYIDEAAGTFIVTSSNQWRDANPDIISLSQVTACNADIQEKKEELYRETTDGKRVSYNPPRYAYSYEFTLEILVNSPWFSEIHLDLSDGDCPESKYTDLYRDYERELYELKSALMGEIDTSGQVMPLHAPVRRPLLRLPSVSKCQTQRMLPGPACAAWRIPESSARTAATKSRSRGVFPSAASADGDRQPANSSQNSVRSAVPRFTAIRRSSDLTKFPE